MTGRGMAVRALIAFGSLWLAPSALAGVTYAPDVRQGLGTSTEVPQPAGLAAGDFNGDGKSDLATANSGTDRASILFGDGAGGFGGAGNLSRTVGDEPRAVAGGDLNGNDIDDVATANAGSNNVTTMLGPTLSSVGPFINGPFGVGAEPYDVAAGDLDGDGRADLAVANRSSGTVSLLFFDQGGAQRVHTEIPLGGSIRSVAIGDFNGDGKNDVAAADYGSGKIHIVRGDAFVSIESFTMLAATDLSPRSIAAGDFDGDGTDDIAVANRLSDQVVTIRNQFNTHFFSAFPVGDSPRSVAVADLDGDGRVDIVTANADSDDVSVLLGDGFTFRAAPTRPRVGDDPREVVASDFTSDGIPDLATANFLSDDVSLLESVPGAGVSHTSLSFPTTQAGDESAAQTVTVTNTGAPTLHVGAVTASGPFSAQGTCANASVARGQSCTIDVRFTPAVRGAATGTLEIASDAEDSPRRVTLSGSATAARAVLSATTLGFPNTRVGRQSAPRSVTLRNAGDAPLRVSGVGFAGDDSGEFVVSGSPCPAPVAPGGTCTVSVAFAPTERQLANATLSIVSNSPGNPLTVALSGRGIEPVIAVTPASIEFPGTGAGEVSAPRTVTVRNTGDAPLDVTSVALDGENAAAFMLADACTNPLIAPGGTCKLTLRFAPSTFGPVSATVRVASDAPGSPHSVDLSGTGTQPAVGLSATSVEFPTTRAEEQSPPRTVTVTNVGNATLRVASVTMGGAKPALFKITGQNCTNRLIAAGASCTITMRFAPKVQGPASATLQIASNAPGSPHTVALSATAAQKRCPNVDLRPFFCS